MTWKHGPHLNENQPRVQRYGEYSITRTLLQSKNMQKKRKAANSCCDIARTSISKHLASVTPLVEKNDGWRQFLSNFKSVLTHLKRENIRVHVGCYRPLTSKAEAELFKKPMYPLNYKGNGIKRTFVEGQCVNNGVFTPNGSQRRT